jgi:ubiquinone/menaquinone biosynthesis C-methylase UbiE
MEAKELIEYLKIVFLLVTGPERLFEKLQGQEWYVGPQKNWLFDLSISSGSSILEVGCASGGLSEYIAKEFYADVVGVDRSDKAIRIAQKKYTQAQYTASSGEKLPFANEYFDFVVSASLINIVDNPKAVLSEMIRVTKGGGKVSFLVPSEQMTRESVEEYAAQRDVQGFFRTAFLFWAKNGKKMNGREIEKIVDRSEFKGRAQVSHYMDGMLTGVTLHLDK